MNSTKTFSKEAIKNILLERKLYVQLDDQLEFDTLFSLDSLSLLWFLDGLEQSCGITLDAEEQWDVFTSVNSIYDYIANKVNARQS